MQVRLESGNCDIIASNEVFLYKDSNELIFRIDDDDGSQSCVTLRFVEKQDEGHKVQVEPEDDYNMTITCFNFFSRFGTGLKEPIPIGESMGKNVYLLFSTKQHTNKPHYVRSVRFTLYREQ